MAKQNGRFKYSREFLMEIRDQRSKFIDQIQAEIFEAYCYCMNGKYWDPEKHFEIGKLFLQIILRNNFIFMYEWYCVF